MKIVCDACEAKYFVSDDKIHKRAVRLTCQKCGHVIVARRGEGNAAHGVAAADLRARLGLGKGGGGVGKREQSPSKGLPADWYYSRDGQSYGPFTRAGLSEKFENGELGGECYVWHRMLGDWEPANSTEPFASFIASKDASSGPPPNPLAGAARELGRAAGAAATASAAAASARDAEGHRGSKQAGAGEGANALASLRDRLDKISVDDEDDEPDAQRGDRTVVDTGPPMSFEGTQAEEHGQTSTPESDGAVDPEGAADHDLPEVAEDELSIDLDVDGASRLVDTEALHRALDEEEAGPTAPAEPEREPEPEEAATSEASSGPREVEPDLEVDLDVDGASRVVSLADLMQATEEAPSEAAAPDSPQSSEEEGDDELAGLFDGVARDESGAPVERSMLIHIDHLKKQNRKARWYAAAAVAAVLFLGAAIWLVATYSRTEVEADETRRPGRALFARSGAEIDDAEFERLAPLAEFSMVDDGTAGDTQPRESATAAPEAAEKDGGTNEREAGDDGHSNRPGASDDGADNPLGIETGSLEGLEVDDDDRGSSGSELEASDDGPGLKRSGSGTLGTSGAGARTRRRARIDLSDDTEDIGKQLEDRRGSKYKDKVKASDRARFVSGLRDVSRSVMDCHRRHIDREGNLRVRKVYLTLTVQPDGSVSKVGKDKKVNDTYFAKCIDDVRGRWSFATFEGKPVRLRQGFVLE